MYEWLSHTVVRAEEWASNCKRERERAEKGEKRTRKSKILKVVQCILHCIQLVNYWPTLIRRQTQPISNEEEENDAAGQDWESISQGMVCNQLHTIQVFVKGMYSSPCQPTPANHLKFDYTMHWLTNFTILCKSEGDPDPTWIGQSADRHSAFHKYQPCLLLLKSIVHTRPKESEKSLGLLTVIMTIQILQVQNRLRNGRKHVTIHTQHSHQVICTLQSSCNPVLKRKKREIIFVYSMYHRWVTIQLSVETACI